jgi:hypothetical protein
MPIPARIRVTYKGESVIFLGEQKNAHVFYSENDISSPELEHRSFHSLFTISLFLFLSFQLYLFHSVFRTHSKPQFAWHYHKCIPILMRVLRNGILILFRRPKHTHTRTQIAASRWLVALKYYNDESIKVRDDDDGTKITKAKANTVPPMPLPPPPLNDWRI